ncbi:MAG: GNAT family N-acetyltransferase [Cyanobacteria bacterium]|nr:GNAT family N-acetyltransferase [Cyanobacteriota bacterium]MEB3268878.1 GNAT family N-acetyltransferase [Leptolyngbya sp.]
MVSSPSLNPSPYRVRSAAPEDLHQLADILTSSFYPPTGWRQWAYPLLRLSIYEDLKQRLRTAPNHYACLAVVNGTAPKASHDWLVGTVEMSSRRYPFWMNRRSRHVYLANLAVRTSARRQGVARHLLTACEQTARSWGFRELYLHVMEDNARAQRVYQQAGFQVYQTEDTLLSFMGIQPRRLLMRKILQT